jgi:hypothetical protein
MYNILYVYIVDPEPAPENGNKFKDFKDLYGVKSTSEQHCPSLKEQVWAADGSDSTTKLSGETIRDVVHCLDCHKPRYFSISF